MTTSAAIPIEDYLIFCQLAYGRTTGQPDSVTIPNGWLVQNPVIINSSGLPTPNSGNLNAVVFINNATQQIVIAYRGSATAQDWEGPNEEIATGQRPAEFNDAETLYKQVVQNLVATVGVSH